MFDTTATTERVHTSEDILVQVKSLLRFRHSTARVHEDTVKEIRVSVMQLATNPRQRTSGKRTKRLFLPSSNITQNPNILRKNILARSNDRNRWSFEIVLTPLRVRIRTRDVILFEFAENVSDLQTLLKIIILIRVDELQVLATVKDNRMILVVRLAIAQNRVTGQLDPKLRLAFPSLRVKLRVSVNQRRVQPRVTTFPFRTLLVKVRNLQIRIRTKQKLGILQFVLVKLGVPLHGDNKLELAPCHTFELTFEFIRVTAEQLHDLRVLHAVKQFDRL